MMSPPTIVYHRDDVTVLAGCAQRAAAATDGWINASLCLGLLAVSILAWGCATTNQSLAPGTHSRRMVPAGPPPSGGPHSPFAITVGPDHDLWFTEYQSHALGRITPAGDATIFILPAGGFPERVAAGPNGTIWFTDPAGNRIGRFTPQGGVHYFPLPEADSGPAGITAGPDGDIWFTEHAADRIGRLTSAGSLREYPLGVGSSPGEIVAGRDGNLWFTESGSNQVGRITPDGTVTNFPVPTEDSEPGSITAAADGTIWFTELAADRIGRIRTNEIDDFPLNESGHPLSIAVGADGTLWVTQMPAHAILHITRDGQVAIIHLPTGGSPVFLAAGPKGDIWFTELQDRIGRIASDGSIREFSTMPAIRRAKLSLAPVAAPQ